MVGAGTVGGGADPATDPGMFRIVAGPFTRTGRLSPRTADADRTRAPLEYARPESRVQERGRGGLPGGLAALRLCCGVLSS
jgi:hypothetical protein